MPVHAAHCARLPAIFVIGVALAGTGCTDPASLPVPTAAQPCPPCVLFPAALYSKAELAVYRLHRRGQPASQAERPADLDQGRPFGPADGQRETLAVETYQQGKIKAFPGTARLDHDRARGGSVMDIADALAGSMPLLRPCRPRRCSCTIATPRA